jgi:hypothetical protein
MIAVPSEAKTIAICAWAPRAISTASGTTPLIAVKNPCGFFGTPEFSAKARSFRKKVVRSAKPPARRSDVAVGLGAIWSPLANWMITALAGTPASVWPPSAA